MATQWRTWRGTSSWWTVPWSIADWFLRFNSAFGVHLKVVVEGVEVEVVSVHALYPHHQHFPIRSTISRVTWSRAMMWDGRGICWRLALELGSRKVWFLLKSWKLSRRLWLMSGWVWGTSKIKLHICRKFRMRMALRREEILCFDEFLSNTLFMLFRIIF